MYHGYPEEGDNCPEVGCKGELCFAPVQGCSCHINPPCSACVDNPLCCPECGWEEEGPDLTHSNKYETKYPVYQPRELDKTKIDYRIKSHSSCSQICEGVYPEDATQEEVLAEVRGTFGGRFTRFGNGHFEYIAYTD